MRVKYPSLHDLNQTLPVERLKRNDKRHFREALLSLREPTMQKRGLNPDMSSTLADGALKKKARKACRERQGESGLNIGSKRVNILTLPSIEAVL